MPSVYAEDSGADDRDDQVSAETGFEYVFGQIGPIASLKKQLSPTESVGPKGQFGGMVVGGLPTRLHVSVSFEDLLVEAEEELGAASADVLNSKEATDLMDALAAAQALEGSARVGDTSVAQARTQLSSALYEFQNKASSYVSLIEQLNALGSGMEGEAVWVEDEEAFGGGYTVLAGTGEFGIQVVDLSSGLPVVSLNENEPFTMASTYKLFVASSMIDAVESGEWNWSDGLMGMTLSECFDTMIIDSDNDCPEAWLETTGWESMTPTVEKLGAQQTEFSPSGLVSTPSDLARVLQVLMSPDSMSEDSHNRLFWAMENQIYRDGIPAALDSVGTVADKVGFLEPEELHDAAVVYTPKGDYAIVIMTVYLSWDTIAQMTQAIYDYL